MASRKWFVVDGKEELGPLGPSGLRRLVKQNKVLPSTMVRREDHEFPIRADHLRGLFGGALPESPIHASAAQAPSIQGPFESLRLQGWGSFVLMCGWVGVGILGIVTAFSQRERALEMVGIFPAPGEDPTSGLLEAGSPFLGLGSVYVVMLFVITGVPFSYWLWNARMNLPHLIVARMRFAPSWAVSCWFVPFLNLVRPYQVIEEVDRLSAEAAADGDARVRANSALLAPWWVCTVLMAAFALTYKLMPVATVEEIAMASIMHIATAIAVTLAAAFGAVVFLRITWLQERAHDAHPVPVKVHYPKRGSAPQQVG